MENDKTRDALSAGQKALVMENMRKASDRAQVIAGFWFYLTLAIGILLLNKWIIVGSLIFAARVIWVRWRDRWCRA